VKADFLQEIERLLDVQFNPCHLRANLDQMSRGFQAEMDPRSHFDELSESRDHGDDSPDQELDELLSVFSAPEYDALFEQIRFEYEEGIDEELEATDSNGLTLEFMEQFLSGCQVTRAEDHEKSQM